VNLVVLGRVLENLQQFQALFEDEGVYTITAEGGEVISLFDVRRIYEARYLLPMEEAVAIEVSLYHGANGHNADSPYIIGILRRLCVAAQVDYEEPPVNVLGSDLCLLGGFL
jgi:hypothetical protein